MPLVLAGQRVEGRSRSVRCRIEQTGRAETTAFRDACIYFEPEYLCAGFGVRDIKSCLMQPTITGRS